MGASSVWFKGSSSGTVQEILAAAGVPMDARADEVSGVSGTHIFREKSLQEVFQVEGGAARYFGFAWRDEERFESDTIPDDPNGPDPPVPSGRVIYP